MSARLTASHLARGALVYVRQSTVAQVFENRESTERQYALVDRAHALGWPREAVSVIDDDLGRSGATTDDRRGFARLAHAVAHGQAGAILALEVSRLARSSQDWQHLLRLCAVADVVVVDEQGVYSPGDRDDKLLLDLKGTMSEAELHWLRLRLTGGKLNKARRGALRLQPPAGYVWREHGFVLDPDEAVCEAVRVVFDRFSVEPSVSAVIRWAGRTRFEFPTVARDGSRIWRPLTVRRLCDVLHNPTYAGTYVFGRRPVRERLVDGKIRRGRVARFDPAAWAVQIPDAHPGYISWETFLANQKKLHRNASGSFLGGGEAPREGLALLGALVVCGRCGRRMVVRYWGRGRPQWSYSCVGDARFDAPACWEVSGQRIDRLVEEQFLATVVPDELELCLAVEDQVEQQAEALARQWKLRIERAEYEARLAERRYKSVDPDNRVVARSLEHDWETRLRELEEVHRGYERARQEQRVELTDRDRERIRALARDLPAVWRAKTTAPADRKAMLRFAVEAVALTPIDVPERATIIRIQWRGGPVTEIHTARPRGSPPPARSDRELAVLRELTRAGLTDVQIAERLNAEHIRPPRGERWNKARVNVARRAQGLAKRQTSTPAKLPLPDRHPDGRYSARGAALAMGVPEQRIRRWIREGKLAASREAYPGYSQAWWICLPEPAISPRDACTPPSERPVAVRANLEHPEDQ